MGCPPLPEASCVKAHPDSKGVVDEPSSETSEKESKIDLKYIITLLIQTFEPDPLFFASKCAPDAVQMVFC